MVFAVCNVIPKISNKFKQEKLLNKLLFIYKMEYYTALTNNVWVCMGDVCIFLLLGLEIKLN